MATRDASNRPWPAAPTPANNTCREYLSSNSGFIKPDAPISGMAENQ
jgi:hypothetical protein